MDSDANFVWIDLEMSGLNPKKDVILEVATVITNNQLHVLQEGPELVIHQSDAQLADMDPWVMEQHTKTGLIESSYRSNITILQAEEQIVSFIKDHCSQGTAFLAGNSVWQDRNFIAAYMPRVIDYLHYRLIDVTTIKELVLGWYADDEKAIFEKKETHRAKEDVLESIAELRHYKKYFFV